MAKRKNRGWYEIGFFIISGAFASLVRQPKPNKKSKYITRNPDNYKITKTQEKKLKNLVPQIKNKELKIKVQKHLDSFMTRKKYKKLIAEVEYDLKLSQERAERRINKKETGYSETNKEKIQRERLQNKKETGYLETDSERQNREEDERDDNFVMYGVSETNFEKKIREQKIVDLEKSELEADKSFIERLENAIDNDSPDIFQEEPTIEDLENVEEELGEM